MARWPIFVISLSDAVERRKPLLAQLRAFSLDFELFDAIDGRNGLPGPFEGQVDRQKTRRNIARDMTDGEYACALSHLAVHRLVIERGLPGAIILEDDAILQPLFPEFCNESGFDAADLIVLDYSFTHVWRFSSRPVSTNISACLLSLAPSLNTAYSISAHGCSYMVENSFPISRTADWPSDITKVGALAAIPRVVDHPPADVSHSSLEAQRRASFEMRYWESRIPQTGGFESRKWRRWLIKRMSRRLA
jgi:glycosyl transferase family 25